MDFGHSHSSTVIQATAEADRLACRCLNVTESEIREVIAEHELQTVQGVSQTCGAGAGCMSCHRQIRRMLNERVLCRRSELPLNNLPSAAYGSRIAQMDVAVVTG